MKAQGFHVVVIEIEIRLNILTLMSDVLVASQSDLVLSIRS